MQSTRAGALFGLGFVGVILFANLVKYPAFRMGPTYAAVTGESLIAGYARLGRWVVWMTAVILLLVQAIIIAATAITTAGIGVTLFGPNMDARYAGVGLIVLAVLVCRRGGFNVLDQLNKLFVVTLTVCTVMATLLALPEVQWHWRVEPFASMDVAVPLFAVAVMGFMPSAIDLSLVHSVWTLEKQRITPMHLSDHLFDFHVGYIGSAALALCFLIMGAGVMYSADVQPETAAPAFARQVLRLYTTTLGEWSGLVVGISALAVMFSTLLAVVDGAPRLQAAALKVIRTQAQHSHTTLTAISIVMGALGCVILLLFMTSFTRFIDFVTTTSFLLGPLFALLNHLAMTRDPVPSAYRLSGYLWWWSVISILLMTTVAAAYFYFRLS